VSLESILDSGLEEKEDEADAGRCVYGRLGRRPLYVVAGVLYWVFYFAVAK
jgi:hypothetical protein